MTGNQILVLTLIFLAVTIGTMGVLYLLRPQPTQDRLRQLSANAASPYPGASPWRAALSRWIKPVGKILMPEEGWENSPLRRRFMTAGFRSEAAMLVYFGLKALLTIALPAIFVIQLGFSRLPFSVNGVMVFVLLLAAIGYFAPNAYLARRIAIRQRELFEALPDALDLMTVCVEAGLALDAAIARVGSEMQLRSRVLAEELHLVQLELRAGATRERALRNLALRTGVEDIDSLVAMLVQTDRFGTSIADSLRVHAEGLRTKRRLRAEEAAAKIPVKLLMPLIFCIFPSMLLVLMGPAYIAIYRALLPAMTGN